jgi:transposase-like protein
MTKISYAGYRFPPEIIQRAIWLYLRFTLSFRNVEDLLAERGIMVSYETVPRASKRRQNTKRVDQELCHVHGHKPRLRGAAHGT